MKTVSIQKHLGGGVVKAQFVLLKGASVDHKT